MKMMISVAFAFAAALASADVVSGYVGPGLVGQWDGIDNAGTGTHDPAATVWKDLTGLTGDGTLNANVKWYDGNCWTNGVDGKPITVGANFVNTMNAGSFTVEFVVKPTRTGSRESFMAGYGPGKWSFEHNSGSYTDGSSRFYFDANPDFHGQMAPVVAGETATLAITFADKRFTLYKNGRYAGRSPALAGNMPVANTTTYFGGENDRTTMAFRGSYYAVRLYNRPLTAAEVAANAAQDAARFAFTPVPVVETGYYGRNGTYCAYDTPLYVVDVPTGSSNVISEITFKMVASVGASVTTDVSYAEFLATATSGTILKTGGGIFTMNEHLNAYNGNVHVAEGTVIGCASNCLGSTQSTLKKSYVHSGATLVMDDPGNVIAKQDRKQIYYEGTGAPGLGGAYVFRSGNKATTSYWPLQMSSRPMGPATIFIDTPSGGGARSTYGSDDSNNRGATDVQFAGQDVFLYGRTAGSILQFNASQIQGIDTLVISNMTLQMSGNSAALYFTGNKRELHFTGGARWQVDKFQAINNTEHSQTGKLFIDDLEYYRLARTGHTGWDPYAEQSNNWWRGEVVLNKDLRFYNSRGSGTKQGFTFNKKVSGPGGIRSWYDASGKNQGLNTWVHLMGTENTFTGGISLNASTLVAWRNGAVPAQEGAGAVVITNGWFEFRRLNATTVWDAYTLPEIVIDGKGTVSNGTGTCRGLVKKGTGVLDYNSQIGGTSLDLEAGTVKFNTAYRANYAGDNAAYAPAGMRPRCRRSRHSRARPARSISARTAPTTP